MEIKQGMSFTCNILTEGDTVVIFLLQLPTMREREREREGGREGGRERGKEKNIHSALFWTVDVSLAILSYILLCFVVLFFWRRRKRRRH